VLQFLYPNIEGYRWPDCLPKEQFLLPVANQQVTFVVASFTFEKTVITFKFLFPVNFYSSKSSFLNAIFVFYQKFELFKLETFAPFI